MNSEQEYKEKYLKYKRKYQELLQKGGNDDIDTLTSLIFDGVQIDDGKYGIKSEWKPFVIRHTSETRQSISIELTELSKSIVNKLNSRGQSLLYIAGRKENKLFYIFSSYEAKADLSIKNTDGSSILHGIAWGMKERNIDVMNPKNYDFLSDVIKKLAYSDKFMKILFATNDHGEFWFHHLCPKK